VRTLDATGLFYLILRNQEGEGLDLDGVCTSFG